MIPMRWVEHCEEKERLVDEYGTAVNEYGRTVKMLRHTLGVLAKTDYDQIRHFIGKARVRCEAVHLALEQHIDEHGC